ncbi:phosphoadenylyl-sulfate reductase [Pseudenhygromyxa sp. WMMC2535]|uniref:phosphoadenylyl-sulfate reductase n=1 Tax=Pseudenhygromyxa sp. WMMC2535 TaxID=2712867 RepID=UPI0015568874|nr:phosphoadenylyl-sulfate reductase [Pseudenhygromyxa sp. WMMC2535]NVB40474.1 phosphoadenylyl-sulfate reductase [Pseudenhygromyxa sp. WMMC2535]
MADTIDHAALAAELETLSPRRQLRLIYERFDVDEVGLSFSGAEDVVLLDFACDVLGDRKPRVFTLDTGRLHAETYRYLATVEDHYGLRVEVCFPQAQAVEAMVRQKGLFSFYEDGHQECCGIRKVEPLRRKLAEFRVWITGQRRDQSPGTRAAVPVFEIAEGHTGLPGAPLYKLNPLAGMASAEVWETIRAFEIPHNPLHARGMISIGCEPCTRAILPGEHERAGRWWWEEATKKECGLHAANLRAQIESGDDS